MEDLSHVDKRGYVQMVDVGGKEATSRLARAWGQVHMAAETIEKVVAGAFVKGDVLAAARIAGIMAAKQTGSLVPLCHPLPLSHVGVELLPLTATGRIIVVAEAGVVGKTGVEMEALTAVSVAALTIYDMCKAVDKRMSIDSIILLEKRGGRSGHYHNPDFAVAVTGSVPLTLSEGMEVRLSRLGAYYQLECQSTGGKAEKLVVERLPASLAQVETDGMFHLPAGGAFLLGQAVLELMPANAGQGYVSLLVVKDGVAADGDQFAALL
jgi:cyclic pyranopterin phosphate synthase